LRNGGEIDGAGGDGLAIPSSSAHDATSPGALLCECHMKNKPPSVSSPVSRKDKGFEPIGEIERRIVENLEKERRRPDDASAR